MRRTLHLTIDEEVYRKLKTRVTNISRFFETLAKSVLEQTTPSYITISPIPAPTPKPTITPTQAVSTLPEAKDLKELYNKLKTEFEAYLSQKVSKSSAEDYISAMDRLLIDGITKPIDLDKIEKKTKHLGNALRNFLNFLKEVYETETLFGKDIEKHWRPKIWLKAEEKKAKLYPEDDEIKAFYGLLVKHFGNEEVTIILFKLLVYSGIRLEHGLKLLATFDRKRLAFPKDYPKVAVYDTTYIGTDVKQSYIALMPREFAEKLKRFDLGNLEDEKVMEKLSNYYGDRLNPKRWNKLGKKISEEELEKVYSITSIGIRTWFQNFLVRKKILERVRDFMVGHKIQATEKEYVDYRERALEAYNEIVDELVQIVPP